ncbi:MAG: TraB/GumN family protein [Candidatus Obscuribacterales bacterium]|nr:TraB/GumN family protein [Candidatus Obscuribacterales bacterium]
MPADRKRQQLLIKLLSVVSLVCLVASLQVDAKQPVKAPPKAPVAKTGAAKPPLPKTPPPHSTSAKTPAAKDSAGYTAGTPEFLWKVTSDKGTAYLIGTLHMVRGSFYPLPKEMETAFHQSEFLVLEIDLSKTDPSVMQKLLATKGIYPSGDSLSKHLTEASRKALSEYLTRQGQPIAAYDKMRPWLVALLLTKGELQKMGFQPELGIDQHFLHEARATEKKVLGLETEEFQISLLAGFPDDLQDEMLRLTLLEVKELRTVADDMMAKWRAGDDKGLDFVLTKDTRKHPELQPVQEKMLYERNVTMTAKIEEMLATGKTHFVAVGSGHMVGEKGIIASLRKKGYQVEQVKAGQALPPPVKKTDSAAQAIDAPAKPADTESARTPDWITP